MPDPAKTVRVRLWDGPVRIVHWLLVGLIAFSWWASDDHLNWHRWSGYTILGLLLFRVWWGFVGSGAAKFSSFVREPRATLDYARSLGSRAPSHVPGHNPLGAWSVLALIALLLVQVGTGLFAVDIDAFEAGPMSDRVSFQLGREIADIHELNFRLLQGLVVLHVAAVLYYWVWKRTDLIGPMITGKRSFPEDPGLAGASWWRLILGAVLAAGLAWYVSKGLRI